MGQEGDRVKKHKSQSHHIYTPSPSESEKCVFVCVCVWGGRPHLSMFHSLRCGKLDCVAGSTAQCDLTVTVNTPHTMERGAIP